MDIFREYTYNPITGNQIRLLQLYHAPENAELEGRLFTQDLTRKVYSKSEGSLFTKESTTGKDSETLELPLSYQALSYFWGKRPTDPDDHYIKILQKSQSYRLPIRTNLESALRQLRRPNADLVLWIDALCIDQLNNQEKDVQIPRMLDIYNGASSVHVWLGEEKEDSARAMNFVHRLLELDGIEDYKKKTRVEDWAAFAALLRRPWFSRRWVVQEIAAARKANLHCGKDEVSWKDFADAVSLFSSKHIDLKQIFKASSKYGHNPDYLGYVQQLGAYQLVHVASNFLSKTDKSDILDRLQSLEDIVSTLAAFDASDERDIIYAVMSLSNDVRPRPEGGTAHAYEQRRPNERRDPSYDPISSASPLNSPNLSPLRSRTMSQTSNVSDVIYEGTSDAIFQDGKEQNDKPVSFRVAATFGQATKQLLRPLIRSIQIRYESDVFEVYRDFLRLAVSGSTSLDIICRPWAADDPKLDLPSWIPRKRGATFGLRQNRAYSRVRADLLVGSPTSGGTKYNASGGFAAIWRYVDDPILTRSVVVRGFVLDTVGDLLLPALGGIIPAEWITMQTSSPNSDALWRTLVANRGPEGQKPPPAYYKRAFETASNLRVNQGYLDTREVLADGCSPVVREFLERVQSVVWMRRLTCSKERRLLGLLPYEARDDDQICILDGCSVPVVLRLYPKTKAAGERAQRDPGVTFKFDKAESTTGQNGQEAVPEQEPEVELLSPRTLRFKGNSPQVAGKGTTLDRASDRASRRKPDLKVDTSSAADTGGPDQSAVKQQFDSGATDLASDVSSDGSDVTVKKGDDVAPTSTNEPQQDASSAKQNKLRRAPELQQDTFMSSEGNTRTEGAVPRQRPSYDREPKKSSERLEPEEVKRLKKEERTDSWKERIPDHYYEFIGECYIHGMMDGEAPKLLHHNPRSIEKDYLWLG